MDKWTRKDPDDELEEYCQFKTNTLSHVFDFNNYEVLDTKYKSEPSDSDFYQATAYSLAKKCDTILLLPEDKREINDGYKIEKEFAEEDDLTIHIKTIKFEEEEDFIQKMESKILKVVNSVRPISVAHKSN